MNTENKINTLKSTNLDSMGINHIHIKKDIPNTIQLLLFEIIFDLILVATTKNFAVCIVTCLFWSAREKILKNWKIGLDS